MKIAVITYAKDTFEVGPITRLAEEAATRGHELIRVRYEECMMRIDNGELTVWYRNEKLANIDAVLPWIIQGTFGHGMSVLRQFESAGVYVVNSARAFEMSVDKWHTAQAFAQVGVPSPDTMRANQYADLYKSIDTMGNDAAVVKITTGTRGNGVILSPDKDTTKSIVSTLAICKDKFLVQEYIAESHGTDVRAYVVGNKVVAAMQRTSAGGFRSNLKQGGSAAAVELSKDDAQLAVRAARAVGLEVAGVDLMYSDKGTLVIEANASGEFGIEQITGKNVAAEIIEHIEYRVAQHVKKDKAGA